MSKNLNHKGKQSHNTRSDKKKHWKHGESSGNPELSKARKERKGVKNRSKGQK
jgi:hypothetical protein